MRLCSLVVVPYLEYRKNEKSVLIVAAGLGVGLSFLAILLAQTVGSHTEKIPSGEVWAFIQQEASRAELDAEFVYAIAWAESSLNAHARTSVARGMMQITRLAWQQVSNLPYRNAWDWKTNVTVAIDYLDYCRGYLEENEVFSYPLLAASYRYGPYEVKKSEFLIKNLDPPKNKIYQQIFVGELQPVAPPVNN